MGMRPNAVFNLISAGQRNAGAGQGTRSLVSLSTIKTIDVEGWS